MTTDPAPAPKEASEPAPAESLDPELRQLQSQLHDLQDRGKNGANWFYWVAALSLVNSFCAMGGINRRFVFGLGVTQAVDDAFGGARAFVFSLIIAGLMALFGYLSNKRMTAFFVLGMVLYSFDGLLLVLHQHYFHAAFHAFVLFQMWQGVMAYRQLSKILSSHPVAA
jgi:hypothetical protein